jgi:hypothetical protein
MNDPFNNHGRTADDEPLSLSSELHLVPVWSIVAAVLSFIGVLYIFLVIVPQHENHHAPFGLHLYFSLSWSALSALYMLMVGYITRDSKRRAMHARLWIIVCLVLPGGIGAVLYFLLRQPVITLCPACSTRVQSEFHFCPQCAYQLSASCARCFKSMDIADRFCVECGYDRAQEATPNRLYAFRDEA